MATPDIANTLVSYAQIKNMLAESNLRDLQTAQMGLKMRDMAAFSAPGGLADQLTALRQPPAPSGMVSGRDLGQILPGQGQLGPAAAPVASPTASAYEPAPGSLVSQLSPGTQQAWREQVAQGDSTPAAPAAMPPGAGRPATPPPSQGGASPAIPSALDMQTQLDRQMQLYQEWTIKHPYAADLIKPLAELDKTFLEQRKGALELQGKGMDILGQSFAGLNDLPADQRAVAYAQRRQLLIDRGIPGAQQIPPQFDQAYVDNVAITARDQKTRVEQGIQQYDALTKRHEALTKQAQLGEGEWKQTAEGPMAWFPKYPGANTGAFGGTGPSASTGMNPATGQPYQGLEGEKLALETANKDRSNFMERNPYAQDLTSAITQVRASDTPEVRQAFAGKKVLKGEKAGTTVNASDLALVYGFGGVLNPRSSRVPPGAIQGPQDVGALDERAKRYWDKLWEGGELSQTDRDTIRQQVDKLATQHMAAFDTNRTQMQADLSKLPLYTNRPAHIAYATPDLYASIRPQPQAGGAGQGPGNTTSQAPRGPQTGAQPRSPGTTSPPGAPGSMTRAQVTQQLQTLNAQRQQAGQPPLTYDQAVAQLKAKHPALQVLP